MLEDKAGTKIIIHQAFDDEYYIERYDERRVSFYYVGKEYPRLNMYEGRLMSDGFFNLENALKLRLHNDLHDVWYCKRTGCDNVYKLQRYDGSFTHITIMTEKEMRNDIEW